MLGSTDLNGGMEVLRGVVSCERLLEVSLEAADWSCPFEVFICIFQLVFNLKTPFGWSASLVRLN